MQFENLSFGYRGKPAIFKQFSWAVPAGRTVLLGPNGTGKSTLLNLAAGVLKPKAGTIQANAKRDVGWMPQNVLAINRLTVHEQVAYAGWLKGLSQAAAWEQAQVALAAVDLTERADDLSKNLSGGQLRRVGLAQTIIHQPSIILLDEPTVGLDPTQRQRFRTILASLPNNHTMLVSTHQVDDLAELFDTVVVLYQGQIRFQGSIEEFLAHAPNASPRPAEAAYAYFIGGDH
ncbi:ABC transporter ATP-binding protein [Herpetosiphon llansteffanensis]|uniref:ABC transporter ATP-binding protein n=1 Tax=Herpetosiphon llansteffanensis TaxID=2094568 RepID=UPI000D7D0B27|nr:ATP-binding cassette domain-containing protein [Herpetosiphon llansteffanensis]